jgi:predicted nucleic acid-binding protein
MDISSAFFDANIIIDVLTGRTEFYKDSKEVIDQCSRRYISALSIHIVHYFLKGYDRKLIKNFLSKFEIVDLTQEVLEQAYIIGLKDFEDSIQLASCLKVSNCLVTRNKKDFKKFEKLINIVKPSELINL